MVEPNPLGILSSRDIPSDCVLKKSIGAKESAMFFSFSRLNMAAILFLVWLLPRCAVAEVVNAAADGFTIKNSLEIAASPQRVYDAIVKSIGSWWSSSHTFSGNSRNLSMDDTPGGCFCERWNGKAGVWHMTVVYADPGKRLRLSGGLGPLQDMGVAGSLTFDLTSTDGKTRLDLTYHVGGYSPDGLTKWASAADSVLLEQITRLKRYIETGSADSKI